VEQNLFIKIESIQWSIDDRYAMLIKRGYPSTASLTISSELRKMR
jgi:hypothetical protein